MPTILRSSAMGKLREGSTTTVPASRSSGSLAGYRSAKMRRSSSYGQNGGAIAIAKDNQSGGLRTSPDFAGSMGSRESQPAPAPHADRQVGRLAAGRHQRRHRAADDQTPPAQAGGDDRQPL